MSRKPKGNLWETKNDVTIGVTSNGERFEIDTLDLPLLLEHTWYVQRKIVHGKYIGGKYICSQYPTIKGKRNRKFIHNIIWEYHYGGIPDGYRIDHFDRNPLNNKLSNLRLVTLQQNTMNRSRQINNRSGFAGVSWTKSNQTWHSYITHNQERINLGYFQDKVEAIVARLKAEKEYYGEYAPQKYLFKEYGIE